MILVSLQNLNINCHCWRFYKKQRSTHLLDQGSHKNHLTGSYNKNQRIWCRPVQALCMLLQSLWIYVSFAHVDLEGPVFLASSIPSASYILSVSSFMGRRGIWWTHSIYRWVLQGFHLLCNVWLRVYIFVPICCRRKLLWWWLSKALINEYCRMSGRVIILLLFFF